MVEKLISITFMLTPTSLLSLLYMAHMHIDLYLLQGCFFPRVKLLVMLA